MLVDMFNLLLGVMILMLEVRPGKTGKSVVTFMMSVIFWILFDTQMKALSIFGLIVIVNTLLYINGKRKLMPLLVINSSFGEVYVCTLIFSYYRHVQWNGQYTIFLLLFLFFSLFMNYDRLIRCSTGFLLFLFSFLLLCVSVQAKAFSGILFPECLTTLVSVGMFVLTCAVIYIVMKKDRIIEKNRFIQKTETISKQQVENWMYQTDQFLHEKHDLIHAMNDIYRLIIEDRKDEALSCVEKVVNQMFMDQQPVYCNDIHINSLIQSKASQEHAPVITTDIHINEISTSLSMDLCLILSELIDAASMAMNHGNSGHTLNITMTEKAGTIILKTSYPHQNHSEPADLDMIMDVVNRYHGVMEVEDGEYDTVRVLLIIPQN